MSDIFVSPAELKFVEGDAPGTVEGYGAFFGNRDSHGDVILPGAFSGALAEHKAAGTMPAMYVEHGPALGGSSLPDGVWTEMSEDSAGLRVKGRISALDTDHGKRIRALVQDNALRGLSIGYKVGLGNAVMGKLASEPRRSIKSFEKLFEVSLVTSPSNALAKIESVKSLFAVADKERATLAARDAIALHMASLSGQDSPTAAERGALLTHLQDVHEALTGSRMPVGVKSAPQTLRELEAALRELGFSKSQATDIAERGLKTAPDPTRLRDADAEAAAVEQIRLAAASQVQATNSIIQELGAFTGFKLPNF